MDSHTYMQLLLACKYNKNHRIRARLACRTFDSLLQNNIIPYYYLVDVFKDTIGTKAFNEYVNKNKSYFELSEKYTMKRRPINRRWTKIIHKVAL